MTAPRRVAPFVGSIAMLLALTAPAAADHIGGALTLCGQVLDYVAPTAVTDGSLSINGVSDPDPHSFVIGAGASLTPADSALLTTIAASDNFTCLAATGDGSGVLTAVAIDPGIPSLGTVICGPVTRDASDAFVLTDEAPADTRITLTAEAAALIAAAPGLDELFAAFADFGAQRACVVFTMGVDGVVDSLRLGGGARVCGQLEDASADPRTFIFEPNGDTWTPAATITLEGITIPSSTFPRSVLAALEFTSSNQATAPIDACFHLDITFDGIVPAMSRVEGVDAAFCGDATEVEGDGLWLIAVNVAGTGRVLSLPEIRGGQNLEQAILLTMGGATPDFQPPGGCLFVTYTHDGVSEFSTAFLNGTVTFEVVSRTATQIVLRRISDGAEFSFTIGPGSDVPSCMQPGYRSAGEVDAFNDGRILFSPFSVCPAAGAGGIPDTAANEARPSDVILVAGLAMVGLSTAIAGRRRLTRRA